MLEPWERATIRKFDGSPSTGAAARFALKTTHRCCGNPPLGAGECAQGPTAAAIANAVYDALGIRVHSLPLTADQLIAAMPD